MDQANTSFQQRVVVEKEELALRLHRLNEFISTSTYSDLPEDERIRLAKQSVIMKDLYNLLCERIAAFQPL